MIKAAIVGCGKIADLHAAQIERVAGARIVAVCDREPIMAAQLAERCGAVSHFTDVAEMLREVPVDVVHLTTPPQSHFPLGKTCLEAGCHVYIEKPFTVDTSEAEELLQLAELKGLLVTPGHNVQFGPEMVRMRELVDSGYLGGPPVHLESIFSYDLGDPSYVKALLGDRNHFVRSLPGKLLQNIISHGIAKIAEFIDCENPSVLVHGHTSPALESVGETSIQDELRVIISDRRNMTAYFTFTTQIRPGVQELRIFGPKNSIFVDNGHRTVVTLDGTTYKSFLTFFVPPRKTGKQYLANYRSNITRFLKAEFHMDAGMKNLFESFYRSISGEGQLPISYREILLTCRIMDKIFAGMSDCSGRVGERSEAVV